MKMRTRITWIAFLVVIQFCGALCDRTYYFEHFFSKHHRGHSTTEAISSSTTSDISSSEEFESSTSDYVINKHEVSEQTTNVQHYPEHYERRVNSLTIGLIVGCIVTVLFAFCCIFCCLRHFCRRKERPGFIISNQTDSAASVNAQQPVMIQQQQQQQPPVMQHYPPDHPNEHTQFIPPFQHQQVHPQYPPAQPEFYPQYPQYPHGQPQFQYTPDGMQYHNPPEAPPPYEFPEKF